MVRLSPATAVALMATTACAIPFGNVLGSELVRKQSNYWFALFNYEPDTLVGQSARSEQLFVSPEQCTTLENMWDKDVAYITVGPGIYCNYYRSENCTNYEADFRAGHWVSYAAPQTESSGPHDVEKDAGLKGDISSYICYVENFSD